jgi:membrane associated rhomboid family serine protease
MLVLADNNPVRHIVRPYGNYALIALCVAVFLLDPAYHLLGFTPALLHQAVAAPAEAPLALLALQLVSYIFLHGDVFHLAGNMIVLWVFGNNIEDSMGHRRYPAFFVLCGVAGALAEGAFSADPAIPVIGASGAVAGVMGAYLLLHPRARVLVLVAYRLPILIPASLFVGFSIGIDLLMALLPDDGTGPLVAWWAHLGGFAAGVGLILLMRHRDVALFQPAHIYPENAFGRLGRFMIDLGHGRDDDAARAGPAARAIFAVKTLGYFLIIIVAVELLLA